MKSLIETFFTGRQRGHKLVKNSAPIVEPPPLPDYVPSDATIHL